VVDPAKGTEIERLTSKLFGYQHGMTILHLLASGGR